MERIKFPGFDPKLSCETRLVELISNTSAKLDGGLEVDAVVLQFSFRQSESHHPAEPDDRHGNERTGDPMYLLCSLRPDTVSCTLRGCPRPLFSHLWHATELCCHRAL